MARAAERLLSNISILHWSRKENSSLWNNRDTTRGDEQASTLVFICFANKNHPLPLFKFPSSFLVSHNLCYSTFIDGLQNQFNIKLNVLFYNAKNMFVYVAKPAFLITSRLLLLRQYTHNKTPRHCGNFNNNATLCCF